MGPSHEYKVRIRDYHFNTSIKRNWSPSVKVVVSKKRGGRSAVPMHFLCLTPNCSEWGWADSFLQQKKLERKKQIKRERLWSCFLSSFIKYESCLCLWAYTTFFPRILWGLSWESPLWGLCHAPIQNFCTNSKNSQEA